jgi:hypothetical protein
MRWLLSVAVVLCVPSLVLCNPHVDPYDVILFDAGNGSPCVWPEVGETFHITVYLGSLEFASGGIYGIQFGLARTFGASSVTVRNLYTNVGGLSLGDPEVPPGFAMTVGATCVQPNANGVIPLVRLTYVYTGTPGTLTPIPYQGGEGSIFADCENDYFPWASTEELGGATGVGMASPYGCGGSAVRDMTWGSIKALYR